MDRQGALALDAQLEVLGFRGDAVGAALLGVGVTSGVAHPLAVALGVSTAERVDAICWSTELGRRRCRPITAAATTR